MHLAVTSHFPLLHLMCPESLADLPWDGEHLNEVHAAPPIMFLQLATDVPSMEDPTGGVPLHGGVPSATVMPPIHLGLFLDTSRNQSPLLAPVMVRRENDCMLLHPWQIR